MPPVFDNYCDDNYAIENNYNHPYVTCHNYEGNHFPTKNHPSNILLVYHVQVLYDDPTPIFTNKKDFAYVENINTFMHMDHDKNASSDGYIVDFTYDTTESFYERGKHGSKYLNKIRFPLFMLKFAKLHLFCLPMLVTLCFIDLFSYKIPMHRKRVRLKYI